MFAPRIQKSVFVVVKALGGVRTTRGRGPFFSLHAALKKQPAAPREDRKANKD
jgi:hypothetical protein